MLITDPRRLVNHAPWTRQWMLVGLRGGSPAADRVLLFEEGFEGTGAPAGWFASGAANFDYTASPLVGSQSLRIPSDVDAAGYDSGGAIDHAELWIKFRIKFETLPIAAPGFGFFEPQTNSSTASIRLNTNGTITITDSGLSVSATTVGAVVAGNVYDFWFHLVTGTGSDAVVEFAFANAGDPIPTSGDRFASFVSGDITDNYTFLSWYPATAYAMVLDSVQVFIPTPVAGDGTSVDLWPDSSGNGHNAAMTGSNRPTFKTAIVNGKPVVRFTSAGSSKLDLASPISGVKPYTIFVVMKTASSVAGVSSLASLMANTSINPTGPLYAPGGGVSSLYIGDRSNLAAIDGGVFVTAGNFNIYTGLMQASAPELSLYVDGTVRALGGPIPNPTVGDFSAIGYAPATPTYGDGDIAEIICYNVFLSGTDRANIEKYLGTKYAITVAGGSAVEPDTVTGLVGWWKADSLGT